MALSIILAVVVIAVYFLISWSIAGIFYDIAKMKNCNDKRYFWMCFLLGITGYLMVVALPDRSKEETLAADELPNL